MEGRWKLGAGASMGLIWFFPTPKEVIHSANVNPGLCKLATWSDTAAAIEPANTRRFRSKYS